MALQRNHDRTRPGLPVGRQLRTGLIALAAFFFALLSCGSSPGNMSKREAGSQPVPVVVAAATRGDISIYLTGIGSVVPSNTVTLHSRIDGQLDQVLFKEGQIVDSGALLAVIDPRPFEAQLEQARGQLVRDEAFLANARIDLRRYEVLAAQQAIPEQQLATQRSLVRQYEGTVEADRGLVRSAKVQLVYTRITSPVAGMVGLLLVDPGNIVHATDANGMAVLTTVKPITVIFTIAEDNLPRLLAKIREGFLPAVVAYDRSDKIALAEGRLLALDNRVDSATGTVRLRAVFSNDNLELFPGQFVNAHLLLDVKSAATVIPQEAIQRGPQGTFVYLVNPDLTVTVRQVVQGPAEGDRLAVEKGLSPGDRVVVEGADRLHEGSRVQLQESRQAEAP